MILIISRSFLLRIFCEKNLLWSKQVFINKFLIFWPKSRLQTLIFYFSYFRDLFFESDYDQLEHHSFAHLLVATKKIISSGASKHFLKKKKIMLSCFLPSRDFKSLISLFSYFKNLFFKSDSYQFEELFFVYLLLVTRKKIPHRAQACIYWKKKKFSIFDPNRDVKH